MQYNNPYSAYANLPVQPTAQPMYQTPYMQMNTQQMPMQTTQQMQQLSQQQQMNVNQQQQMTQQMPIPQQQISHSESYNNGGFIVVASEEDVKRYLVAPGNLVTFKIENQPIVIEKSMGWSQFASPHYERYKLQKEDMNGASNDESAPTPKSEYKDDLDEIKNSINDLKSQVDSLRGMIKQSKPNSERKFDKKEGDRRQLPITQV